MATNLQYSSALKDMPFLFTEMRKTAGYILEDLDREAIINISETDNVFQINKPKRKRDLTRKVLTRLATIDEFLLNILAEASFDTAKYIAFYALLKTDKLLFEFMYEVYKDKYTLKDLLIEDKDFTIFFDNKAHQSEKIASWKQDNLNKIRGAIKRTLIEAGLAKKKATGIEITPPFIDGEVIDHIKSLGDDAYLKAMLAEV